MFNMLRHWQYNLNALFVDTHSYSHWVCRNIMRITSRIVPSDIASNGNRRKEENIFTHNDGVDDDDDDHDSNNIAGRVYGARVITMLRVSYA